MPESLEVSRESAVKLSQSMVLFSLQSCDYYYLPDFAVSDTYIYSFSYKKFLNVELGLAKTLITHKAEIQAFHKSTESTLTA